MSLGPLRRILVVAAAVFAGTAAVLPGAQAAKNDDLAQAQQRLPLTQRPQPARKPTAPPKPATGPKPGAAPKPVVPPKAAPRPKPPAPAKPQAPGKPGPSKGGPKPATPQPGRDANDPTDRPLPEPKPPAKPTQPSKPAPTTPAPTTPSKPTQPGKGKDDTSDPLPETPKPGDTEDGTTGPGRSTAGGDQTSTAPTTDTTTQQPQPQPQTPTVPTTGQQPATEGVPQSPGGGAQRTTGRRGSRSGDDSRRGRRIGGAAPSPDGPTLATLLAPLPLAAPRAPLPSTDRRPSPELRQRRPEGPAAVVERTVREIVRVVPAPVKAVLAVLAGLVIMLGFAYLTLSLRTRRLERQREELLQEIGLLQAALLPTVPDRVGTLFASVAYRPADGPAAGGDFYDAFPLDGGRVGIVVGDVAGHGRDALAQTTLLRYTLRVYLETGLEPRKALNLAGGALREDLGAGFATALVAVYDPADGVLRYASAGHPPPVLLGPPAHEPVTAVSSPPIGIGAPTGLRQTTVAFGPDALACFFTDGLTEARVGDDLLGRERLEGMLRDLGREPSARALLERIVHEAEHAGDDMAACVIRPTIDSFAGDVRIEELELDLGDPIERLAKRFLEACGVAASEIPAAAEAAIAEAGHSGAAVLRVRVQDGVADVSVAAPFGVSAAH